jgi:hypothetical protein
MHAANAISTKMGACEPVSAWSDKVSASTFWISIIRLNIDYPCWQHKNFDFVIDTETGCINIGPILVHELGHAFGLGHSLNSDSIMNEVIHVTKPLDADVDRVANQIILSIDGDRPGIFKLNADNGAAVEWKMATLSRLGERLAPRGALAKQLTLRTAERFARQ